MAPFPTSGRKVAFGDFIRQSAFGGLHPDEFCTVTPLTNRDQSTVDREWLEYIGMAMFFSEGVYRVGGGVSAPWWLSLRKPEYTKEARAARIEGGVDLLVTIGQDGIPRDLQIQKGLGYGLDERAIECVTGWRFSPGVYEGKPVPVAAMVSVGFSLSGRFGTELRKALRHWTAIFR